MILGIYSDLHSNLPALHNAIKQGRKLGVERWISLGDSIGLFPFANEVLFLQRSIASDSIMGDHEEILLSGAPMSHSITGNFTICKQREEILDENLVYLSLLPRSKDIFINDLYIKINHTLNESSYTYNKYEINLLPFMRSKRSPDIVFFGHTHFRTYIQTSKSCILNPGSLGFPVDGSGQGSYLIYDTKNKVHEFHYVNLEAESLIDMIIKKSYPKKLIEYIKNGFIWKK
jgi:predicted phosphodiesterase